MHFLGVKKVDVIFIQFLGRPILSVTRYIVPLNIQFF